jgi:hypothetical protein
LSNFTDLQYPGKQQLSLVLSPNEVTMLKRLHSGTL